MSRNERSILFKDLMEGFDSAKAYMEGTREGYQVHSPAEIELRMIPKGVTVTPKGCAPVPADLRRSNASKQRHRS